MPPFLLLLACASSDGVDRRARAPSDTESTDTDPSDTDSPTDSAAPEDSGLAWSGDLAPYDGCAAGDPGAKLLSQRSPSGPVAAGSAVNGEAVFANCEAATWVAAATEECMEVVKFEFK